MSRNTVVGASLVAVLGVVAILVCLIGASDMGQVAELAHDGSIRVKYENHREWVREIVRGGEIRFVSEAGELSSSGRGTARPLESLGPLDAAEIEVLALRIENEARSTLAEAMGPVDASDLDANVAQSLHISKHMYYREKFLVCAKQLREGNYWTFQSGTRRPRVPEGYTSVVLFEAGQISGKMVDVVFPIDRSLYPTLMSHFGALEDIRSYIETDSIRLFNSNTLEERTRLIDLHIRSLALLRTVSNNMTAAERQGVIRKANAGLLRRSFRINKDSKTVASRLRHGRTR